MDNEKIFNRWFPPYLLCATLCNWGYILFLIGHIFGKFIRSLKEKKLNLRIDKSYYTVISFSLILLFSLTFINKLEKPYNNHFVTTYSHSPIPLTSPFEVGFFQHGNNKYAKRKFSNEDELIKADWYFTNKQAFNDCKNFVCAITSKPETVLLNIRENLGWLARNLTSLFFSTEIILLKFPYFIILFIISLLISIIGFVGIILTNPTKINLPLLSSIIIGCSGYIAALALTGSGFRYVCAIIPVAMTLIVFSSDGLINLNNKYYFIKKKIQSNKFNSNLILFFIVLSLIFINISFQNKNFKNKEFVNIIINNNNFINKDSVNYFKSYKEVFNKLNKNQKILSSEDVWISGFANVDIDKVKGIYILPPFEVSDDSIEKILNNFDIITVSNELKKRKVSLSTQSYLRYELHLKGYLEKNLDIWNEVKIQNYGSIFKKKSSY